MTRPRSSAVRQTFPTPLCWLTHTAFIIAIAIIIARLTTPDMLRDPWGPTPDPNPTAAGPGATTSLVFDLLAMVPGVLVCIRNAMDRHYSLAHRWSHPLLFALAGFALLNTFWASDRFLAIVNAFHFFAASCLLWAMSQLVRSALRFRVVAAAGFGLLLVLLAQSVLYRFVEVPANVAYWNEKKVEILKSRGWQPGSFPAVQFEHKLTSGEPIGFFNSPNSVAAVAVLLFAACAGIGIQKVKDGENFRWLILTFVAAISLAWVLIDARSKTSAATPFIGAGILCGFLLSREKLKAIHAAAFVSTSTAIAFILLAVICHGIYHHGLFPGHLSNSLDFRWKYWVASFGMFKAHPILGVGWGNFGLNYLAHRVPEAAEEIKDPHNFLIKFLTELGLVGVSLCVAWLMRTAWEITKSAGETTVINEEFESTIRTVIIAVLLGMLLNIFATVDFGLSTVDTITLLLKPFLFTLTLLLGTLAGVMRSPQKWTLDERPTTWIFYFLVTGLGLFLMHNLIDFSWFEPGAMICFMALIGSALGFAGGTPARPRRHWISVASAAGITVGWFALGLILVLPIMLAEESAQAGDRSIQTAPVEQNSQTLAHYRSAAEDFSKAADLVPYNSDYLFRQAQATLTTGNYTSAESLLSRVQRMNPLQIDAYLLDANLRRASPGMNKLIIQSDFDHAIALNPNDVTIHIQYAQMLERFGAIAESRHQYRLALAANAALPVGEPKRLSDDQVAQLEQAANH